MKNKGGRPTKLTPEAIKKLEEVFAIGGTDQEACFYADISHQALYNYQLKHPEFVERKEALKEKPVLKARQTVVKALEDPNHAKWFLEKKKRKEFGADPDTVINLNGVALDDKKYREILKRESNRK